MSVFKNVFVNSKKIWVIILPIFFLASCYYDKEDQLYDTYYASKTCDTLTVTYSHTITAIITARCATSGCHTAGGSANGNFDTYAGLKVKVDNGSLIRRTTVLMNMPSTGGALTSCQIAQLKKWVQLGAPNN